MMRVTALIVCLFFVAGMVTVYAQGQTQQQASQAPGKSIFQQASDDIAKMKVDYSDKSATKIFQESGDKIEAGCPEAKDRSLRNQKAELQKRRVGKNIIMI